MTHYVLIKRNIKSYMCCRFYIKKILQTITNSTEIRVCVQIFREEKEKSLAKRGKRNCHETSLFQLSIFFLKKLAMAFYEFEALPLAGTCQSL
jgi:hypothetical protein